LKIGSGSSDGFDSRTALPALEKTGGEGGGGRRTAPYSLSKRETRETLVQVLNRGGGGLPGS
jgi:hypothetical protein